MLGDNIRAIRKSKKLSINKLSKLSGISLGYLSDLENNNAKNPTMDKLNSIADVLGISVNELLSTEEKLDIANDSINSIIELAKTGLSDEVHENSSEYSTTLDIIPKQFVDPVKARLYINKHQIFGSNGFDANKMSDDEILEFANELLRQMELISYKYKK